MFASPLQPSSNLFIQPGERRGLSLDGVRLLGVIVESRVAPLVLRTRTLRRVRRRPFVGVVKEGFQHLFRRADESVDRVHGANGGHPFPIRLRTRAMLVLLDRSGVGRVTNRHPFAVRRLDQDFTLFPGGRHGP